ncbi:hypothetical protein CHS0354_013499 [Potamilus streckersoni]|uniref:Uncharacterized protein n=1 Tax=Potamilus streckersoni TaxID=2493646 RepID=A0AAE0W9S4_9BIVA|nr:hypothetical protein CHS0354_013499 [Potamilus streckersoni]
MYTDRKLGAFLVSLAVIVFSHSSVLGKSATYDDLQNTPFDHGNDTKYTELAAKEKEQDGDEVPLEQLTDDELEEYVNAEDGKLFSELDIISGKAVLAVKNDRSKRWIAPAGRALFSAGRALARTLAKGRTTSSAGKITRQYHKAGDYQSAVRDFSSLSPSNPKPFTGKNGLEGITGQLGNKYTIQARSGSSSGSPTLEIFKNGKPDGSIIRKIRYD